MNKRMERTLKILVLAILAIASVAAISACANSGKSTATLAGDPPTPPDQVAWVGMMVCVDCHAQQTQDWLLGHGANNAARSYPLSTECQPCHDRNSQGYTLYPTVLSTPHPVVPCEACHGGGANHYGIGPIPYPNPGYAICGQCHNGSHHSEMTLIEEYTERQAEGKGHISSINQHVFTDSTNLWIRPLCARCHTDEGFKDYVFQVPGSTRGLQPQGAQREGEGVQDVPPQGRARQGAGVLLRHLPRRQGGRQEAGPEGSVPQAVQGLPQEGEEGTPEVR